ncbi:hypothetical protein [Cellulomonas sp. KRMCY2]|uniref:hypothetical protein n=1 Tax=Cellulomonas sp. KRMCY2 TaxID=1304865 RepID=UPI00045E5DEC|nr:hypothetical protein [Cellulomonas sp. KRMCY2]
MTSDNEGKRRFGRGPHVPGDADAPLPAEELAAWEGDDVAQAQRDALHTVAHAGHLDDLRALTAGRKLREALARVGPLDPDIEADIAAALSLLRQPPQPTVAGWTRDQRRSWWLAAAVAGRIAADPVRARVVARRNLTTMRSTGGTHGPTAGLDAWAALLDGPLEELIAMLTGTTERCRDLRQLSPFAGLLSEDERRVVLAQFRAAAAGELPLPDPLDADLEGEEPPDPLAALVAAGLVAPSQAPRRAPKRDRPLGGEAEVDAYRAWERESAEDGLPLPPRSLPDPRRATELAAAFCVPDGPGRTVVVTPADDTAIAAVERRLAELEAAAARDDARAALFDLHGLGELTAAIRELIEILRRPQP